MNDQVSKPALPPVYKNGFGSRLAVFGLVMFVVFLASAYLIAVHRTTHALEAISLGAAWVMGVPLFFLFEHVYLFRRFGDATQYEQFKRSQELASKVWAGAIIVLAAFFAQTFPK